MSSSSPSSAGVFRVCGVRSFVSSSTVPTLIAPLLVHGQRFSHIAFNGHSYDLGAAEVIASAIKSLPIGDLIDVNLSDCLSGRPLNEAVQILKTLCDSLIVHPTIESLDLSNNAIGVSATPSILPLLHALPNLQRLYLNNNGMPAEPLVDIVNAVKGRRITHFEVADNMMDSEGAEVIVPLVEASDRLEHFRMAKTRVKPRGGKAIVAALVKSKGTIKHLDLLDNSLGEDAGYMLGKWINDGGAVSLRTLLIGDVGFDRKGLKLILNALAHSPHRPSLTHIDLQCSDITPKLSPLFKSVIAANRNTIEMINLEGNKLHSIGVAALVDEFIEAKSLKMINLIDNGINRTGKRILQQQLQAKKECKVKVKEDDEDSDDDDDEPEDQEEEDDEEEDEEEKEVHEITEAMARSKVDS